MTERRYMQSSRRRVVGWSAFIIGTLAELLTVAATFLAIWSSGDLTSRWGATAFFAGLFGIVPFAVGFMEVFGND